MAVNKDYNCKQMELYFALRSSNNFCKRNIADLAGLKSKYTLQYIQDIAQEIDAAEAIKDLRTRNSIPKKTRIKMEMQAGIVCRNWQMLKRYLIDAYADPAIREANLQAAGAYWYSGASNFVRTAVQSLINAGNGFITAHQAELEANDNMPAAFATQFAVDAKVFNDLLPDYSEQDRDKAETTDEKILADNAIYAKVMLMLADARTVYVNNPEKKKQATFTYALQQVTGNGAGKLHGIVTDQNSNVIPGVTVSVQERKNKPVSNVKGRFKIDRIAAKTYTILFTKAGFEPHEVSVTIKTATTTMLKVALKAA